ncbi:MAG: hypothetical protein HYZ57_15955 [Acidobacteria bacterium]|nr:hypothetical protein [Acidobacteriota bacterium]
MQNDELRRLIELLGAGASGNAGSAVPLEALARLAAQAPPGLVAPGAEPAGPRASGAREIGRLIAELEQPRRETAARASELSQTWQALRRQPPSNAERGTSGASGISLPAPLAMLGLSPVLRGILGLFRGRREPEPLRIMPFLPPPPVREEIGFSAVTREFTPVVQSQSGLPRPVAAPAITINVQALDSRSFLDHSSEIASAVKDALLHSHSLNDIVAEI